MCGEMEGKGPIIVVATHIVVCAQLWSTPEQSNRSSSSDKAQAHLPTLLKSSRQYTGTMNIFYFVLLAKQANLPTTRSQAAHLGPESAILLPSLRTFPRGKAPRRAVQPISVGILGVMWQDYPIENSAQLSFPTLFRAGSCVRRLIAVNVVKGYC